MFNYNKLSEIEFHQENTLAPRSVYHRFFDADMTDTNTQSLNGFWYFDYSKNLSALNTIEYYSTCNVADLDTIKVPGHIQLQGYGNCQYVNVQYPWDGIAPLKPGEIMRHDNPIGTYVLDFDCNIKMLDQHIIEFLGAENALAVWLNGEYVGYSEDSFTTSSFDITSLLKDKANRLVVQVFKYTSASWLESQDFWRFSGLFRDVNIYSVSNDASQDIDLKTTLTNDYKTGTLSACVYFNTSTSKKIRAVINDQVTELDCTNECAFEVVVQDVCLWSAEKPNLYTLTIEIETEDHYEVINTYVGFVEYKIEDAIFYVNGKRVIFNGVNRHEFSHKTGRFVSLEDMILDLEIMKQHNVNAIRTSHYPNHPDFYRLCDEHGFYVIDEMNLETHGSWQMQVEPFQKLPQEARYYYPGNDERVLEPLLTRANNMYQRDKNFTSICMLSCGNEALGGKDIYEVAQYFKKLDSARIVHYEGVFNDRSYDISDVESRMYDKIENVEAYLNDNPTKPFIYCEYAHAMGNSLGNLDKFQDLTRRYSSYQGGFIWEFKDHGLLVDGELKYGGDFGDRPCDYNFVCDGLINADSTLTAKIKHLNYVYQPFMINVTEDKIVINNEYLFTDLNEFEVRVTYTSDTGYEETFAMTVDCPAMTSTEIEHILQADQVLVEIVRIEALGLVDEMHVVAYQQKVFLPAVEKMPQLIIPTFVDGNYNIGMSHGHTRLLFSKVYGFNSIKHGQDELLAEPVRVNVGRAFIDNDRGARLEFSHGILNQMSTNQLCQVEIVENRVRVRHYILALNQMYCDVYYGFDQTGQVVVEVDYPGMPGFIDFLDFGMVFKFHQSFTHATYHGAGPYENYCDRNSSSIIGNYEFDIKDNMTNYIYPQECGNRTQVCKSSISNAKKSICFSAVDVPFEFNALPYSAQQIIEAKHLSELNTVTATNVRISHKHCGVGGDDSWGARPHNEFLIDSSQPMNYKFTIKIV